VKVVITVVGKDRVGIIAAVSQCLAAHTVNIVDISQTILQDYFTMIMLAELSPVGPTIGVLQGCLSDVGVSLGVDIRVQSEEIFTAMHKVSCER
jgi:ACT domain-containing protein